MKNLYVFIFAFSLLLISCGESQTPQVQANQDQDSVLLPPPVKTYGFYLDSFEVYIGTVQQNWTMSHMLLPHGLSQYQVNVASDRAADSLVGLRYIVPEKEYYILSAKGDTSKRAQYAIYIQNKVDFYVFDFRDSVVVKHHQKETDVKERILTGEIVDGSNLTFAINQELNNIALTYELSESIAGIYAYAIDFFKLHPGDEFKIIFDEKKVEDELVGVSEIKAVWFKHRDNPYYSFKFEVDTVNHKSSYFDENAKQMKRPFLMAPVKYSRISSGYTKRRYHPVQKRWKAHKGTDYAAPKGTPIYATADGTVIAAKFSRYNGNYVKIKHNETYTTQYLHMSKIEKGMRNGVFVKQGQTIGYVGSTGLATGPHVCYRFWKNGQQVDHRALKFPNNVPMKEELIPSFKEYIKSIKQQLDGAKITPYNKEKA